MQKSYTHNGKRYDLIKIKSILEKLWGRKYTDIKINKQHKSIEFCNKFGSTTVPFEDLGNYD